LTSSTKHISRVAIGLLQDEFELCGEFQIFQGWTEVLRETGIELIVFGPSGRNLRASGFQCHPSGEPLIQKAIDQWTFIRVALGCAEEVDLLHIFLPTPNFLWIADRIKLRSGKPVLVHCIAEQATLSKEEWRRQLREAPRFHLIRWIAAHFLPVGRFLCDGYVTGSQVLSDQLKRLGCPEERVIVLPGPLPLEKPLDEVSKQLGIWVSERPTFVYLGHFLASKGVQPLIQSMTFLPFQIRLLLVWSGLGNRPRVERLIRRLHLEARIRIVDQIVHRTQICSRAVGIVTPFPMSYGQMSPPAVVLEAFRAGVPVLTSRIASLRELVNDGKTGCFVNPHNPKDIAAKMIFLLSQPDLIESMRIAQRQMFADMQHQIRPLDVYHRFMNTTRE